jgi:hypothetical protein
MNDELEKSLRAALRPVDPGKEFTRSVLAKVATEQLARKSPVGTAESASLPSQPRYYGFPSRSVFRWASATLAVVLTAGLFSAHQWQAHRTREGLEARRQLLVALQVTGENLDTAYRMINQPERAEH